MYVRIRPYDPLNNYSMELGTIFRAHREDDSNFSLIPVCQQIEDFFYANGRFWSPSQVVVGVKDSGTYGREVKEDVVHKDSPHLK